MHQAFPINRDCLSAFVGATKETGQEVLELLVYSGGECLAAMAYSIRDEAKATQWVVATSELKSLSRMTGAILVYQACQQAELLATSSKLEKCDALDHLRNELVQLKKAIADLDG